MEIIEAPEFFKRVLLTLEELDIQYAVTGSWATFRYGEPRFTQDIDILIKPTKEQLITFMRRFDGTAMAEIQPALDALRDSEMFSIIDLETIEKADFICLKDEPFEREKFARRNRTEVMGVSMDLITMEDSILSKLVWMRESESEMQLRDVAGTMLFQWERLDWNYIHRWIPELRIQSVFERALASAKSRRDKEEGNA